MEDMNRRFFFLDVREGVNILREFGINRIINRFKRTFQNFHEQAIFTMFLHLR